MIPVTSFSRLGNLWYDRIVQERRMAVNMMQMGMLVVVAFVIFVILASMGVIH